MMYACEMVAKVLAKKAEEEEAKRQAELAKRAKALERFKENLESIDAYVEEKLLEGNGCVKLLIEEEDWYCNGFWSFAEKDYKSYPSRSYPYWHNIQVTEYFPLDVYMEYLRDHCFEVEVVECPFTAFSSTGKTERTMPGITLKISV